MVGTTSIEKSEKISEVLSKNNLKHNVLNAKQHEKEAKIIAEAGKIGTIILQQIWLEEVQIYSLG